MSFKIFSLLAQKNINVDIILQTTGRDGKKDMSFTVPLGDAENAVAALKTPPAASAAATSPSTRPALKVSIVGAGMQSHSGVASTMFEALFNQNINIKMIPPAKSRSASSSMKPTPTRPSPPSTTHSSTKFFSNIEDIGPHAQCGAWGRCFVGNFIHDTRFDTFANFANKFL